MKDGLKERKKIERQKKRLKDRKKIERQKKD